MRLGRQKAREAKGKKWRLKKGFENELQPAGSGERRADSWREEELENFMVSFI